MRRFLSSAKLPFLALGVLLLVYLTGCVPGRQQISFFNWFVWAVPLVILFVAAAWLIVIRLGVPRRAISQLNSPVDITLLRRFAQASELMPGDPLYAFMKMVGQDLLDYLRIARERLDFVSERVERWRIPCGDEVVEALFLPRSEPAADEPSAMVGSYIRAQELGDVIAAIIYPDRRGEGFGIGRYEDHPKLDFSLVEGESDVHFAHKSGFMCKTSATEPERLRELVTIAWRS